MPNVTVTGVSGVLLTVPFTGSANYSLASQLAAIINASAAGSNLNAYYSNIGQVTPGGVTEDVVTTSGAVTTAAGTNFLTDDATGSVTVTASPFLNVIAGTGGLTYLGAASGNSSIAVGGGGNLIALPNGSSYFVALGAPGPDTVFANGTGTVDSSASSGTVPGGPNLIFTSQYSTNQNVVYSAGTADTIIAGAGATTIGETGPNALIFLGTGPDLVALAGTGDTVVGSTAAITQTVFGGANTVVFGTGSTIVYSAAAGDAATIQGGVKDTIFGASGASLTWAGGPSPATLVAGTGNETLNGSSSSQPDVYLGSAGSTSIAFGAGADTLEFFTGSAGGTATVSGFTTSDVLADFADTTTPTATVSGGSTIVTFTDGTKVTLSGFTGTPTFKIS